MRGCPLDPGGGVGGCPGPSENSGPKIPEMPPPCGTAASCALHLKGLTGLSCALVAPPGGDTWHLLVPWDQTFQDTNAA